MTTWPPDERDGLARQPDDALDQVRHGRPRAVLVRRGGEHDDVAAVDAVEVVAELVHHDPVADLAGSAPSSPTGWSTWRRRTCAAGRRRRRPRRTTPTQLDDPAGDDSVRGVGWSSASACPPSGPAVGLLVVGVHGPRSMTRRHPGRWRHHEEPVTPPGSMEPWSAPSSSTSTAPWPAGPTRRLQLRGGLRRPRLRSRTGPSSTTISPATTGSSTPSTPSARRPTRPGSGSACATSSLPAGCRTAGSRTSIDALRASDQGADGGLPRGGGDAVRPARGGARHRRLLQLGMGARRLPRAGRPARSGRCRASPRPGPGPASRIPASTPRPLRALDVDPRARSSSWATPGSPTSRARAGGHDRRACLAGRRAAGQRAGARARRPCGSAT